MLFLRRKKMEKMIKKNWCLGIRYNRNSCRSTGRRPSIRLSSHPSVRLSGRPSDCPAERKIEKINRGGRSSGRLDHGFQITFGDPRGCAIAPDLIMASLLSGTDLFAGSIQYRMDSCLQNTRQRLSRWTDMDRSSSSNQFKSG